MTIQLAAGQAPHEADNPWAHHAACRHRLVDPDLFFVQRTGDRCATGRHICVTHCTVRENCLRQVGPLPSAVVGGVFFNDRGHRSAHQLTDSRGCPLCNEIRNRRGTAR